MPTLHDKAYAKLNLYLRVGARREDGYHELVTVFQTVSLCDELSFTMHHRGGISLRTNMPWLPNDARNLAVKAAEAFFAATEIENRGLYINIRKCIPVGAGMAGGSTDAAAVLRTLNRSYGEPLNREKLSELALTLGADVPFCLTGGAALAGGVGERLKPIPSLPDCPILISKPPFSVSTKAAFSLFDQFPQSVAPDEISLCTALAEGQVHSVAKALYNSLEDPVTRAKPGVGKVLRRILELGAYGARMTGSGSAVFGLFPDEKTAENAFESLRREYTETWLVRPHGPFGHTSQKKGGR